MAIQLRNPHSVAAVFETRPQDVIDVRVASRHPGSAWERVCELASLHRVPVQRDRHSSQRSRKQPKIESGRNSAASATVKENGGRSLDDVLGVDEGRAGNCGLYLALDCLQDPHNVGAIFRAAAFFGVRGIVLTRDRSAPLNAAVYDVACGGMEYVPFSVQTNLARTLEQAKTNGLWILGTSERAETEFSEIQADRRWLLVLGNEEKGMRQLTQKKCDVICRLTPHSPVSSLNVSVAAGICIAKLTGAV